METEHTLRDVNAADVHTYWFQMKKMATATVVGCDLSRNCLPQTRAPRILKVLCRTA